MRARAVSSRPILEAAVADRDGAVKLVTVNTDENPYIAADYGIQGIPAVKGFRDGAWSASSSACSPGRTSTASSTALVPTAADVAAKGGDEAALRAALEQEPRHLDARLALGRLLLAGAPRRRPWRCCARPRTTPVGAGLLARAELAAEPGGRPRGRRRARAPATRDPEAALEQLGERRRRTPRGDRLRPAAGGHGRHLRRARQRRRARGPAYRRRLATALY